MIRRRHPGCVSSCGGTACPARTSAPWRRRCQDRPTRCVAIAVQPSAVGNLGPGASEHYRDCRKDSTPTRLAVPGREGPAPAPFRRRMTGTPPADHGPGLPAAPRITKPADLRTRQHAFNTGALNSGALRDHGSRIANRSRHHMRYDRATALDRHVTTSLPPHRRHSRASVGGVGHALAAYRSG
jgi:hypothetical protein